MNPKTPTAWRQDFPVDWEDDHYVTRRDFVKFLVLISGGFVTGQLCIGIDQALKPNTERLPRKRLCSQNELAVGDSLTFTYPDAHEPCLLTRVDEQRWVAYFQRCTHLACAVVPQPEKKRLFCPCHQGAFSLETGQPIQGPPRRPLPKVLLDIEDSEIFAIGVEKTSS